MWTLVSIVLGVIAVFMLLLGQPLALLFLIVSALVFIRGNRIARDKREAERHAEIVSAMRDKP